MAKQVKDHKSAHLRELENVFERRTRRFSPFEVLGLKAEIAADQEQEEEPPRTPALLPVVEENIPEKSSVPMGGSDPPSPGSTGPSPGVGRPSPGLGRPTSVVVVYKD